MYMYMYEDCNYTEERSIQGLLGTGIYPTRFLTCWTTSWKKKNSRPHIKLIKML